MKISKPTPSHLLLYPCMSQWKNGLLKILFLHVHPTQTMLKKTLLADSVKRLNIFVNQDTSYITNNLMAVGIEHVRNLVPFKQFGSSGFPELDIKNFLFSFWFSTMNKLLLWTWHYISRNYLEKIYIISKLIGENI